MSINECKAWIRMKYKENRLNNVEMGNARAHLFNANEINQWARVGYVTMGEAVTLHEFNNGMFRAMTAV